MFYAAGSFLKNAKVATDAENIFIAIFVIMFAAYSAGSAKQHGPSTGKALKAAKKIFSTIDD